MTLELWFVLAHALTNLPRYRYLYDVQQEITCPMNEGGKTLENFLKKRFPIGYVRKLLRKNGVRVNGCRAKADDLMKPNDRVRIYIPFEKKPVRRTEIHDFQPRIETLFEDEKLLVINKPAGIAMHEARGILKRDTVIGILESRYRNTGITPRLVHRLDKDTSGVVVIAKNEQTAEALEVHFKSEKSDKEYLCLLAGRVQDQEGRIDLPLPGREGRPVRALTRFKIERRFPETTLVRVWIATGRMHQIRLHFADLGYPIVMDEQHGDFRFNRRFRQSYGLKRQFLHAHSLGLEYAGRKQVWTAPLPDDLQQTLNTLKILKEKLTGHNP